jgi:hypothetical protein
MLKGFAVLLGLGLQVFAQSKPPHTLQIYREKLRPGIDAAYREIENQIANDCISLGFPHAYIGIESLTGPKEIWFLNGWESAGEQTRVKEEYSKNSALAKALDRDVKRKADLILEHVDVFADYRRHVGRGAPWSMGTGRFLVITMTKGNARIDGTEFEAADGTKFILTAARTRNEADVKAAAAGSETRIFAIRPYWSKVDWNWVTADRDFWNPNSPY